MSLQDILVDSEEGIGFGETDGKYCEVSLKAWVDGEATSSRVHTGNILYIADFL